MIRYLVSHPIRRLALPLFILVVAGCQTQGDPSLETVYPRPVINQPPALKSASDRTVCIGAIADTPAPQTAWSQSAAFQMSVAEAKRRDLSPGACAELVAILASGDILEEHFSTGKTEGEQEELASIAELIKRHDPKGSIWAGSAWGHKGSGRPRVDYTPSIKNMALPPKPKPAENLLSQCPKCPRIDQLSEDQVALYYVRSIEPKDRFQRAILKVATKVIFSKIKLDGKIPPKLLLEIVKKTKQVATLHLDEWQRGQATIYLRFFSAKELISLQFEKNESPYNWKTLSNRSQIENQIKARLKGLLAKAVKEVLVSLVSQKT